MGLTEFWAVPEVVVTPALYEMDGRDATVTTKVVVAVAPALSWAEMVKV